MKTKIHKEIIRERAAIELAYCNGEQIEARARSFNYNDLAWIDVGELPNFDWTSWHYRIKTKTKLIPFTRETFPFGAILRPNHHPDPVWILPTRFYKHELRLDSTEEIITYDNLLVGWEISEDQGKSWNHCGVEQ